MPIMFLFILNDFPAGLTFYYFVSNLATLGQQELIKRFVDEGSIREKLAAHAPLHGEKSRLQSRLKLAMRAKKWCNAHQRLGWCDTLEQRIALPYASIPTGQ